MRHEKPNMRCEKKGVEWIGRPVSNSGSWDDDALKAYLLAYLSPAMRPVRKQITQNNLVITVLQQNPLSNQLSLSVVAMVTVSTSGARRS